MCLDKTKQLLDSWFEKYNQPSVFIENDPISIPHRFSKKQDIEIAAFFAATLAWGQRKTIIQKCSELMQLMDNAPHDFIVNHTSSDLKSFLSFKHRTFQATDVLYFIYFLQQHYQKNNSLESAFSKHLKPSDTTIEAAFVGFKNQFIDSEFFPLRTGKHIASPAQKSTCKRLCMFLRWMVRTDAQGVDFGIWKQITPAQLCCPLDVHVERIARALGLIHRPQTDWQTVLELTAALQKMDDIDPIKYDVALFGYGVEHKEI